MRPYWRSIMCGNTALQQRSVFHTFQRTAFCISSSVKSTSRRRISAAALLTSVSMRPHSSRARRTAASATPSSLRSPVTARIRWLVPCCRSLLVFTVLFALAEGTSAVQTPIGYAKAIAAWFDRRRGLALGIAMGGVGLGGFVMPQLSEALIERVGWRGAYALLGVLTVLVAFPVVALWI